VARITTVKSRCPISKPVKQGTTYPSICNLGLPSMNTSGPAGVPRTDECLKTA
jgi:hypothetical protein